MSNIESTSQGIDLIKNDLSQRAKAGIWLHNKTIDSLNETFGSTKRVKSLITEITENLPAGLTENREFLLDIANVVKKRIRKTAFAVNYVGQNENDIWRVIRKIDRDYKKPKTESEKKGLFFYYLRTGFLPASPVNYESNDFFVGLTLSDHDLQVLHTPDEYQLTTEGVKRKRNLRYRSPCGGFYSSRTKIDWKGKKFDYPLVASINTNHHGIKRHETGHHVFDIILEYLNQKDLIELSFKDINGLKKEFKNLAEDLVKNPLNADARKTLQMAAAKLNYVFWEDARDELAATHFGGRNLMSEWNTMLTEDTDEVISLYDYWSHYLDEIGLFKNGFIRKLVNDAKDEYYDTLMRVMPVANFMEEKSRGKPEYSLFSSIVFTRPLYKWLNDFKALLPSQFELYEPVTKLRHQLTEVDIRHMYFTSMVSLHYLKMENKDYKQLSTGMSVGEARQRVEMYFNKLKAYNEHFAASGVPGLINETVEKSNTLRNQINELMDGIAESLGFDLTSEIERWRKG